MSAKGMLLVFLISLGDTAALTAQEPKNLISSEPDRLGAAKIEYFRLTNSIYYNDDPESKKNHISDNDKVAGILGQMHKIVQDQILAMLGSPHPDAPGIARAIEQIQGAVGPAHWGPTGTNTPLAELVEINGGRSLVVCYAILRGGSGIPGTVPFLEFYGEGAGQWSLVATADSNLTQSRLFVRRVASALSGQVWFLVWGKRIGPSDSPLNLRLYGYDGSSVRTISRRDNLSAGTIQLTDKSVTLDYDPEFHAPFQKRVHETLYITPSGLK